MRVFCGENIRVKLQGIIRSCKRKLKCEEEKDIRLKQPVKAAYKNGMSKEIQKRKKEKRKSAL